MKTSAIVLALLLAGASVHAAEVYRWKDEKGRVHYGDTVPEGRKSSARPVVVRDTTLTDSQKSEAAARLERDRATLNETPASQALPSSPPSVTAAGSAPTPQLSKCEAAWTEFNDSYACFDPHRFGQGKVRPEGYEKCKQVVRPEAC